MYRFAFVTEEIMGHKTHAANIKNNIPQSGDILPYWIPINWTHTGKLERFSLYRNNWTVQSGVKARVGIKKISKQNIRLDAIFFHTQVMATLVLDWLHHIPSVVSLDATPLQFDSMNAAYNKNPRPRWREYPKWRMNYECFAAARHLVTWSDWAKQGLIDDYRIHSEKVTVIRPGVDLNEWHCPNTSFSNENVKIIFVGGDFQRKGGQLLLESYRELRSMGHEVELHIVTQDNIEAEPGVTVYRDVQPNSDKIRLLYHLSDIFCLPTYGDCLPLVLAEAGAAGLPVVSTQLAAIPEIVTDQKTGFLVPVGDKTALIESLQALINNPSLRAQFSGQARENIERRYDARQNTEHLLNLLKSVADRG